MTTEEALKHSILLTHGTVYGVLVSALDAVPYHGLSPSICKFSGQDQWRDELWPVIAPPAFLEGVMTDMAPIDFVHWDTGTGFVSEGCFSWWRQCMTLFMRHI